MKPHKVGPKQEVRRIQAALYCPSASSGRFGGRRLSWMRSVGRGRPCKSDSQELLKDMKYLDGTESQSPGVDDNSDEANFRDNDAI